MKTFNEIQNELEQMNIDYDYLIDNDVVVFATSSLEAIAVDIRTEDKKGLNKKLYRAQNALFTDVPFS